MVTSEQHEPPLENCGDDPKKDTINEQPLSKTQAKKLAKIQRNLDKRLIRRKEERERKKIKKKDLVKEREKNGLPPPVSKRKVMMADSDNKFRVVIDMDFNDYMTDHEISKATQQLNRIYALNRASDRPCQLYFSSLHGKILDRFAITNAGYKSWDVNISDKHYLHLLNVDGGGQDSTNSGIRNQIIYLTGDSEDTLPPVDDIIKDESKIYVIGGLVDHNRHKNLCLNRAREQNIKTAQIPIRDNIKLCQRHVLSTVTVFELMLNVLGSKRQWPDALRASIPQRKIAPGDRPKNDLGSNSTTEVQSSPTQNRPPSRAD